MLVIYVGRLAATPSLDLHLARVSMDVEGKVIVNEADRTSAHNIYAIGDIAKVYYIRTCTHCTYIHTYIPQGLIMIAV